MTEMNQTIKSNIGIKERIFLLLVICTIASITLIKNVTLFQIETNPNDTSNNINNTNRHLKLLKYLKYNNNNNKQILRDENKRELLHKLEFKTNSYLLPTKKHNTIISTVNNNNDHKSDRNNNNMNKNVRKTKQKIRTNINFSHNRQEKNPKDDVKQIVH